VSSVEDPGGASPLPFHSAHVAAAEAARQKKYATAVDEAAFHLRVQREARQRVDAEERGGDQPPEILILSEWLQAPDVDVEWRIEGLQPINSRVLLAAQHKAGKTTAVGNLVRSLVDEERFLGRYAVQPLIGQVAILDLEMSRGQLRKWLRDQRIVNAHRVRLIPLRGRAATLNLIDRACRARWVTWLREHDVRYLIFDPLRPVLDALGLDENRDVGRFLVAFDAMLLEAGIGEALIVHHMGHASERSRGDSRLRDYPDVEWRIMRQSDDPSSPRYFTAYGRDVDVPESVLTYDPATRRLVMAKGSRRDAQTRAALKDVTGALSTAKESLSLRQIEAVCACHGHSRKAIRDAVADGIRQQLVIAEPGPKRAILHRLAGECASAPQCADSAPAQSSEGSAAVRRHPIRVAHSHARAQSRHGKGKKRAAH
jgi:hypothetical protein